MKKYIPYFASLTIVSGCGLNPKQSSENENQRPENLKPNIVFIVADDLGYSQTSCYGSDYYKTPNIDRIAAKGMRFTNAYSAAAVSSPTRASLMTGKYPARLHLTDFIPGDKLPNQKLKQPEWQKFLELEEYTIAEALKDNGFVTGAFGKWHLSSHKRPPQSQKYNPDKQGFDQTLVTYKPTSGTDPENDPHNVKSITDASVKFIQDHKDTSFFLYVSHNSIHDPLMENKKLVNKYKENKLSEKEENHPTIGAMVEVLDNGIGKVLDEIERLNLSENTIVIFYSDNGGKSLYAKQTPLRAGKGWLYEGGIRVPLIVYWANVVKAGSTCDKLVSSIDFYPTFLDMLDLHCEVDFMDGKSIVPLLKQEENFNRDTLYWHYPHYHYGSKMKPAGAIRIGNYKLIEWYEKTLTKQEDAFELYDLSKDIGEQNNLITKMPEKAKELKQQLIKWRESVWAQMPVINE